jgi:hypothetical protein
LFFWSEEAAWEYHRETKPGLMIYLSLLETISLNKKVQAAIFREIDDEDNLIFEEVV